MPERMRYAVYAPFLHMDPGFGGRLLPTTESREWNPPLIEGGPSGAMLYAHTTYTETELNKKISIDPVTKYSQNALTYVTNK